jgi:uncharacterized protein YbaR (Trm112 family)
MIDPELLRILCCPETHQALAPADPALVERLNRQIGAGQLRNRGGEVILEPMEAGLVRTDGQYLYMVRNDIPIMLIDEAVPLAETPR